MNLNKPALVESTYQRDGKWYTLRTIDRSNQIEVAATDAEIAAQKSTPNKSPDLVTTNPAKKVTKKAKAQK